MSEEHETQNQEQQTNETQTESKISWHVGGTSRLTMTIGGAPYALEFPNQSSVEDLLQCSHALNEILKDILKKREEAKAKAEEPAEEQAEASEKESV